MESIDVFLRVDGLGDALFVDVLRQWQLHDESIDIGVFIQIFDTFQDLFLGHIVLETNQRRLETAGFAGQHLVFYVSLRTAVVSDENGRQMGSFSAVGDDFLYFLSNFSLDLRRSCFSIY